MKPDPERIWLQNADDAKEQCEGRLWCEDKVWPAHPEDGEPVEYIRADLHRAALLDAHQRGKREGLKEAAEVARCAFDDRPRRDDMNWNDGFDDGTKAAEYAIRAKIQEVKHEA